MASVFLREEVLYPDYLPDYLPHREAQIRDISFSLRPALNFSMPDDLFIYGPPGTGKTAVVRYVFRELEGVSRRIKPVYINAWMNNTPTAVFTELARKLGLPVPRRGISQEEVLARIREAMEKERYVVILALDEADQVIHREKLLYQLTRLNEESGRLSLILISNSLPISSLDSRIRSSLNLRTVEFPRYTVPELKDIVRERAELALVPGSYTEEALALCAVYGYKEGGDARVAIQTLRYAGRLADYEGLDVITRDVVKRAYYSARVSIYRSQLLDLDQPLRQLVVEVARKIKNRKKITSGQLYLQFCDKYGRVSERTFRYWIQKLRERGIISTSRASVRGNVYTIYLNIPPDVVLHVLGG